MFSLTVQGDPSAAVLELVGELDSSNAHQLADAMRIALKTTPESIDIDCAGLTFIDSSGIAELIVAWRTLKEDAADTALYINNLQGVPRRALEMCGVTNLPHR